MNRLFEITENHLKLFKRMYVSWHDCEYGAPSIDPKRPYGNSDVVQDIGNILGLEKFCHKDDPSDYHFSKKDEKYIEQIHKEMKDALQICLFLGKFKVGKFEEVDYFKWKEIKIKK